MRETRVGTRDSRQRAQQHDEVTAPVACRFEVCEASIIRCAMYVGVHCRRCWLRASRLQYSTVQYCNHTRKRLLNPSSPSPCPPEDLPCIKKREKKKKSGERNKGGTKEGSKGGRKRKRKWKRINPEKEKGWKEKDNINYSRRNLPTWQCVFCLPQYRTVACSHRQTGDKTRGQYPKAKEREGGGWDGRA